MPSLKAIRDAALCEIIRADLHFDLVSWSNSDAEFPQFSGEMTNNFLVVFEYDAEVAAGKRLFHGASHLNELLFCHNCERMIAFAAKFGKKG